MIIRPARIALKQNLQQVFQASGGVGPYTFAVAPGGAGGTVHPTTGMYLSPAVPSGLSDKVIATDSLGATATATVAVLDILGLICDIIEQELNLGPNRVWMYNQKVNQPKDSGMFVVLQYVSAKPFGVTNGMGPDGKSNQSVNMSALIQIDVQSRDTSALLRKEEVLMALSSDYAATQQTHNSFRLGVISTSFVNLSEVDGGSIPYRFTISFNVKYAVSKSKVVPYFNTFQTATVIKNP